MIVGCIYGEINLEKCLSCSLSNDCEVRKNFMPRSHDRGPDASTNDFIFGRGEFDPYNKVRKIEIIRESDGYRSHIIRVRKELGLDNPAGTDGC
jgi:hypothetical protein